jgi:hypothetical protein
MAQRKARKLGGLKADGSPNAAWTKFKTKLNFYDTTPLEEWTEYDALGHILKRYKDYMGIEYSLSYSGAPSKCGEIYCTKRMILALGSDEGETIKNYIDFIYDTYIIPGKVSFSSLAYFFTPNFIFAFKKNFRKESKITRSTKLPEKYINVLSTLSLQDVTTYGDLAFALAAINDSPDNSDLQIYSTMFSELENIGFNRNVLGSLDGN